MWCLVANVNRDTKKKPSPYTPAEFLKDYARNFEYETAGEREMRVRSQEHVDQQRQIWRAFRESLGPQTKVS